MNINLVIQCFIIFTGVYTLSEFLHGTSRLLRKYFIKVDVISTQDNNLITKSLEEILYSLMTVIERWIQPDYSEQMYD